MLIMVIRHNVVTTENPKTIKVMLIVKTKFQNNGC